MHTLIAFGVTVGLAASAYAGTAVEVTINGTVFFNGIGDPPLNGVLAGDTASMSFLVDSNDFVEGVPGDTRGYIIDAASFSLDFGDVSVGLLDPFPAGQTPYFGIVEGFPVSDGFFVSTSTSSPGGVPLAQEPFNIGFNVGYTGDTLSSLDILDAVGAYDFTGLTNFGYNVWSIFPDNVALGIDFVDMTITAVPAPAALALFLPLAFTRRRR